MATTFLGIRNDYAGGTPPGTGTPFSADDFNRRGNALDTFSRILMSSLGPGFYPYPDVNSFLVTAGAGLTANIAAGHAAVYVSSLAGHVPLISDGDTYALPASKTDWYLFANAVIAGTPGDPDSRDSGYVTYSTAASSSPATGQLLLAKFTTGVATITSITDMRTITGADGAGQLTKSVAGSSNVTLTATEARNLNQNYTGVLAGSINVIVPTTPRAYNVRNDTTGAHTLTVKTASGTGVAVAQGTQQLLFSDGTNVVSLGSDAGLSAALALKANIASPTFTGTPAAPTAAVGTNTTQLATTAFVQAQAALFASSLTTATVQTTDATVTNIATHTPTDQKITTYKIIVQGIKSDFSQAAAYEILYSVLRSGGTVTAVAAATNQGTHEIDAAWDATADFTGTTVRVRVTGAAATTINWKAWVIIREQG